MITDGLRAGLRVTYRNCSKTVFLFSASYQIEPPEIRSASLVMPFAPSLHRNAT